MGTYYNLVVPPLRLVSEEESSDSSRHGSVDFGSVGAEFSGSAGRLFFVQEYLRAAGFPEAKAYTEDHSEGPPLTRGYESVSLDALVRMIQPMFPGTVVVLMVGEADLHRCAHEAPSCGSDPVSHHCFWAESSPDRAVCEVCPYFRGEERVRGSVLEWGAVKCAHPDAYRNLLSEGALTPGASPA